MRLIFPETLTASERDALVEAARSAGFKTQPAGPGAFVLFGRGNPEVLESRPDVLALENGHPLLTGRAPDGKPTVVEVEGVAFGSSFALIAGPCAVEDEGRLLDLAHRVKEAGGDMLRGGAYKPRTSPYSFRGLGVAGLEMLARAREATGLPVVTEVLDTRDVPVVADHADMLQIGSRNMTNHALLAEVGRAGRPVLLKRGMGSTIDEWLLAAEYVLLEGNSQVVLCERGIRTFNRDLRNTLDVSAIPLVRERSHLPVLADPSHATGRRDLVPAMALAAAAAGAGGIMLEVHDDPDQALSDGEQAVDPDLLPDLFSRLRRVAALVAEGNPPETP